MRETYCPDIDLSDEELDAKLDAEFREEFGPNREAELERQALDDLRRELGENWEEKLIDGEYEYKYSEEEAKELEEVFGPNWREEIEKLERKAELEVLAEMRQSGELDDEYFE